MMTTAIYDKEVWVLMDRRRRIIAKGTPRNRHLVFVDDQKDNKRILTYRTKATAEANSTGFWLFGVEDYLSRTYKLKDSEQPRLDAVKARLVIEIEDK